MTIFDQFRRENSNILNFLPLKIVNFDTEIKMSIFQDFQEFVVFGQKNEDFEQCAKIRFLSKNWEF